MALLMVVLRVGFLKSPFSTVRKVSSLSRLLQLFVPLVVVFCFFTNPLSAPLPSWSLQSRGFEPICVPMSPDSHLRPALISPRVLILAAFGRPPGGVCLWYLSPSSSSSGTAVLSSLTFSLSWAKPSAALHAPDPAQHGSCSEVR